jgi:F-type H+-transporting ATPase subunit b
MIELPNVAALYVFLAFGICYWILRKFLFTPLTGILDAREASVRDAEKRYTQSLAELERAVASGEEKLSEARREALKTREALRAEGTALLDARLAEAHDAGRQAVDRGAREIETQSSASARELPEKARAIARELAEKILGRKLAA